MASSADVDVKHQEAGSHQEAHQGLPPAHEITTSVFPPPQESNTWTFSREEDDEDKLTGWWKHEDAQGNNSFRFELTDEGNEKLQGIEELPLLIDETNVDQTTTVLHLLEVIKDAKHLSLERVKGEMGREVLRNLAEFLKLPHNPGTLELLNVHGGSTTSTSSEVTRCIFVALESGSLAALKSLRIRNFELTNDDMQSLGRAVGAGNCKSLEKISLSLNEMSSDGWESFAACLPGLPNLRSLYLGKNTISRSGHIALADAMQSGKLGALKVLQMVCTDLDDYGLEAFAKAMGSGALPALEDIKFYRNKIGEMGAKALAKAIASGKLSGLTHINLEGNWNRHGWEIMGEEEKWAIGDEGVKALAYSFRPVQHSATPVLTRLRELHLYGVGLSESGVEALSNSLAVGHLNSLRLLYIYGNDLSEKCANTLLAALISNDKLQLDIGLDWNRFPELERLYEEKLEQNRKLEEILY